MQLDRAEVSRWTRASEETGPKYQARGSKKQKMSAQSTKNTYKKVSEARESKISGDSSVRSLLLRDLKECNEE